MARTSLLLLLLIIAISPITQNIWQGDDFFHGQDIETTFVLGLTLASMSLLRMKRSRIDIDETLKRVRDFLSSIFGAWLPWYSDGLNHYSFLPVAIAHSRGRPGKHAGYELPLLI